MRRSAWLGLVFVALTLAGWGRAADSPEEPIYQGKTLTEWIGDLKSPTASTRSAAAKTLHVFGPAKGSVLALAAALKDERHEVVLAVAQTLGKFGSRAREALPDLRAAFKRLEEKPIESPYGTVYRDGSYGPSSSSQSHPVVTKSQARAAVAEALVLIEDRPGPELAPVLVEAYRSGEASKRRDVVSALGKLGPDAAKVTVPALVQALENKDVRLEAVNSLARIGPAAKAAIHPLTLLLKKASQEEVGRRPFSGGYYLLLGNKQLGIACATALGRIRSGTSETLGAMRLALRDLDDEVRSAAVWVLRETVKDRAELLRALRPLLRDKTATTRQAALEALGASQGATKVTFPLLVAALKDERAEVRTSAVTLLAKRGKDVKRTASALVSALRDADPGVRSAAAESLGNIGAKDNSSIRALIAALDDRDESVFGAAGAALAKNGSVARAAIPRLLAISKQGDFKKRAVICIFLAHFGPAAKETLPFLGKQATADPEECVRLMAHAAIAKIDGSRTKKAVQLLIKSLKSKDPKVTEAALVGLATLGADAREALPALHSLRESSNDFGTRLAIDDVIEEIESPKGTSSR